MLYDSSSGHPSASVPGRLVDSCGVTGPLPGTCSDPFLDCTVSGFHNQPCQIGACFNSVLHVSGHGLRHCQVNRTPISVTRGASPHSPVPPAVTSAGHIQISGLSPGPDGISLSIGTVGAVIQTGIIEACSGTLDSGIPVMGPSDPSGRLARTIYSSLAGGDLAYPRGSDFSASSRRGALYGRFSHGVGGSCGFSDGLRTLVSRPSSHAHQCSGAGGSVACSPSVCTLSSG